MDRQIVYAGAIPLDTDHLLQSRATMVAIGYLARSVIGDDQSYVDGLQCVPAPGLAVVIGPGSITCPGVVDANPYGSLPVDGDPLVKIGINSTQTTLTFPGSGQYVVSAQLVELQSGSVATTYYNASNPGQTLIGPQGSGAPQASVVQQRVGLQVTSLASVPTGAVPLYSVTIPAGATVISQTMIALMPTASFVRVKLPNAAPLLSPAFSGVPTAPTPALGDSTGTLATTAFVAAACSRNRAAWGAAGSHSWTCPPGVTRIFAKLWAAGGAGGSAGGGNPGGGGGGGGYEEVLLTVQPGTVYALQVGAGGSGSGGTQFDSLAIVTPGAAGAAGSASGPGGGGTAGSSSATGYNIVGTIGVAGGTSGFQFGSVAVGGAGGPSFGVAGGQPAFGQPTGFDGVWPGGGGGGGSSGVGGRGADGLVVIEWEG